MSTISIHSSSSLPQRAPRGATAAAHFFLRALSGWTLLRTALRASAAGRTRNRVAEAREARLMAYRVQNTDPGFAADLLAAVARHEALDDLPPTPAGR